MRRVILALLLALAIFFGVGIGQAHAASINRQGLSGSNGCTALHTWADYNPPDHYGEPLYVTIYPRAGVQSYQILFYTGWTFQHLWQEFSFASGETRTVALYPDVSSYPFSSNMHVWVEGYQGPTLSGGLVCAHEGVYTDAPGP